MMIEKLPSTYASILNALVELYMASKKPVKSRDIAEKLGINEGTVRNSMVALRAMGGYIESKTGPTVVMCRLRRPLSMLRCLRTQCSP